MSEFKTNRRLVKAYFSTKARLSTKMRLSKKAGCGALFLLSLLLTCLSNPGMPLPWLAWLALVPLLLCLENCSRHRQILLFGGWGLLWWCWSVWWLLPAAVQFIGLPWWLALIVWLLLCVSLSAPYWLIGALWNSLLFKNRWSTAVLRALLFALLVGVMPSAIPASLISGQYIYPRLIQLVDIGGVSLLLCAAVLTNLWLVQAFTARAWRYGVAALVIPLMLLGYGSLRIAQVERAATTSITIGWIQPNLRRDDGIDTLLLQTRRLVDAHADIDLLVWPEFPPAFSWSDSAADRQRVDALLHDIDKPLLLNSGYVFVAGTQAQIDNGGPQPYYNAAQLISARGELLGSYYKQRLVPFFEFLPFENALPALRRFFSHSLNYVPGDQAGPLIFKDGIAIAPLICYEMIFPDLAQRQIDNGAGIFINLSNDNWFGISRGSISHLALALFRSVEHHRPWLRVTNSGIGAATDASGRLLPLADTQLQQRAAGRIRIELAATTAFYSNYPYGFLSVAGALVTFGIIANMFLRRKFLLNGNGLINN